MTAAPRAGLEMKLRSLKLPSFVAHHGEVAESGQTRAGGPLTASSTRWRTSRWRSARAGASSGC
jgi:hypothetical protein